MAKLATSIRRPVTFGKPNQQMIENELVEKCRRGERNAQHEIYSRTAERVYRLILRITRNRDDAFDLVQETYVRAFSRADQFDGRSSYETWLCRIAINQALQNQRRVALGDRATAPTNGRNAAAFAYVVPDQKIDVEDALARLPDSDRAILVLRYQEGLDYAEIADHTGCPPGTVASRLNRARERVRDILKKSYAASEENQRAVHQITRGNEGSAQPAANALSPKLGH